MAEIPTKLSKGQRRRKNKKTVALDSHQAVPGSAQYAKAKTPGTKEYEAEEQKQAEKWRKKFWQDGLKYSEFHQRAVAEKDFKKAKLYSKAGAFSFQMSGFGPLAPLYSSDKPKEQEKKKEVKTQKPLTKITPGYGKWVDDVDLIFYLLDLGREDDYLHLVDPDEPISVCPFTLATRPGIQKEMKKTQKRLKMYDLYLKELKDLPEVKEVQALVDKQRDPSTGAPNEKLAKDFIYGLDSFLHDWRFIECGEGGYEFKNPKTNNTISITRMTDGDKAPDAVIINLFGEFREFTRDEKEIEKELGSLVEPFKILRTTFIKKELLTSLKAFLEAGWFVTTLGYEKSRKDL